MGTVIWPDWPLSSPPLDPPVPPFSPTPLERPDEAGRATQLLRFACGPGYRLGLVARYALMNSSVLSRTF